MRIKCCTWVNMKDRTVQSLKNLFLSKKRFFWRSSACFFQCTCRFIAFSVLWYLQLGVVTYNPPTNWAEPPSATSKANISSLSGVSSSKCPWPRFFKRWGQALTSTNMKVGKSMRWQLLLADGAISLAVSMRIPVLEVYLNLELISTANCTCSFKSTVPIPVIRYSSTSHPKKNVTKKKLVVISFYHQQDVSNSG